MTRIHLLHPPPRASACASIVSGPTASGCALSGGLADEHGEDADLLPEGVGSGTTLAQQKCVFGVDMEDKMDGL